MKTELLAFLLFGGLFSACTSSNIDEPEEPQPEPTECVWRFEMMADMNDLREAAAKLDSLESAEIHFTTKISMSMNLDFLAPGTTVPISATGNIKKLGKIRTLWKYGVEQNSVPAELCGTYSLSDCYELRGHVTIGLPGMTYRNLIGEFSGWSEQNIENPQTPFQMNKGTETEPDFVTYIYDIRSGSDGTAPPGGHLWLPAAQDIVAIYSEAVFTSL